MKIPLVSFKKGNVKTYDYSQISAKRKIGTS